MFSPLRTTWQHFSNENFSHKLQKVDAFTRGNRISQSKAVLDSIIFFKWSPLYVNLMCLLEYSLNFLEVDSCILESSKGLFYCRYTSCHTSASKKRFRRHIPNTLKLRRLLAAKNRI